MPASPPAACGAKRNCCTIAADLVVTPIRGNVDTRLRKLDDGEADGLIMAAAGLKRIGRAERISEYLPDEFASARWRRARWRSKRATTARCESCWVFCMMRRAQRRLRRSARCCVSLSGGCHVPIGARARAAGSALEMVAIVASPDGATLCKATLTGRTEEAETLGECLAEVLLQQGADKILAAMLIP